MKTVIAFLVIAVVLANWGCASVQPASAPTSMPTSAPQRPKKIFAHYMGCYPAAAAATAHHRANDASKIRHDANGQFDAMGDRWRNWPLVPDGMKVSLEESADLEIRRALRGGIDGFAIDAWAGGEGAKKVLDALFKVAEEKDYPFEVTICIDACCGGNADSVKYLLDNHGQSPKLARRGGKPLVFNYMSIFIGMGKLNAALKEDPEVKDANVAYKQAKFRSSPKYWKPIADAYEDIEKKVGQPIYWHACMGAFFWGLDNSAVTPELSAQAAGYMAERVPAIGEFLPSRDTQKMAEAVRAKGGEWCEPLHFQYENIGWGGNRISKGFDILRDRWQHARDNGSTLIQFVTWNDYTENTCLAPAYDTRYSVLDLNAWFVQWWKTGKEPATDHDRVYLSYRKYPHGAKLFPFKPKQGDSNNCVLEVLTILTSPAKVRLPGRDEEWDAPAGMSWKQFELKPGAVIAEVVRDGKVAVHLESPEPITDKPFRETNGMTCYSTEFMKHWKADFGDAPPLLRGEYADDDHDGLPNWFEMYWYGKFMDWTTAGVADPNAIAAGGKTVMQHYLDQTAPCIPPPANPPPSPKPSPKPEPAAAKSSSQPASAATAQKK